MAESTVSEEEFSWSLAQALKDFSVESLKAEQVECIVEMRFPPMYAERLTSGKC